MNKQELEKQAEALYTDVRSFLDNTFELIDQIHEPQKVVVPKFVAEWIEETKEEGYNLSYAMSDAITPLEVEEWLFKNAYSNEEVFAKARIFGYQVEQEQLYTVEIPNPNLNAHTILQKAEKGLVLVVVTNARWRGWADSKLTESEIKQDFEWAWDAGFAKEV
ncbi:TPA: DUF1642 domain-containing protein [Streptococcus suis]